MEYTKHNYDSLDALKLILSVLICLLHTIGEMGGVLWIIPITRIAVPTFFAISGFLYFKKFKSNPSIKTIYLPFAKRNAILYAVWFILLLPISLNKSWFEDGIILGIIEFPLHILLGNTFFASWFLAALVVGVGILSVADKYIPFHVQVIISAVVYLLCVILSNYQGLIPENSLLCRIFINLYPGTMWRSFPVALLPLCIGKWLAYNEESLDAKKGKHQWFILIIELACLYAEWAIIGHLGCSRETDCYLLLPFIAFTLLNIALSIRKTISNPVVLRKLSTINYCMHGSLAYWLSMWLLIGGDKFLKSVIIFTVTEVVVFIFGMMVIRFEKNKNLKWLKYLH